jgi:hypothetical protein
MSERGSSTILNLGLVAILVGIGLGGYLVLGRSGGQQAQAQAATTAVTRGNVRATVSASGTIESDRTVGASFETAGTVANLRVEVGDEVVLLGEQDGERITAEELGLWAGTINYEVTTGVDPRRVERSYEDVRGS